ncbi:glucosaminidase domain-containing protein, partial [Enterococcus raffinosus]|uniref:glucosaminidase domain-containing protein n=1 Tax=Enterococcus raffinosus TaxID=71452 RepID=UPI003ACF822A
GTAATSTTRETTESSSVAPSSSSNASTESGTAATNRNDLNVPVVDKNDLEEALLVDNMSPSDLKTFELPLLSKVKDKKRAVLIYEGLKYVGNSKKKITSITDLLDHLMGDLFNTKTVNLSVKPVNSKSKRIGDLVYRKQSLVGIFLDQNMYLTFSSKDKVKVDYLPKESKEYSFKAINNLTLNEYGKRVQKEYPASIDFKENLKTKQFVDRIAQTAQELGGKYDVFASVMIAQAILESASGNSSLAEAPYFNLFGIKGSFKGNSVSFMTNEDNGDGSLQKIEASFRDYTSYKDSLEDYTTLIRGGISGDKKYYKGVWRSEAKNYLSAAKFLTGKYATDTTYHRKIISLISAYHLTKYDSIKKTSVNTQQKFNIIQNTQNIPNMYRAKMKYPPYNGTNYNVSGSYPVGQCTWYAFNRVAQLGKHVGDYMGNGGEWGDKAKALGYKVVTQPVAGYLISFHPGVAGSDPRYGHVAFVEAVSSSGILISECNVVGGTTISYRIIPNSLAKSDLVSYIKPR